MNDDKVLILNYIRLHMRKTVLQRRFMCHIGRSNQILMRLAHTLDDFF